MGRGQISILIITGLVALIILSFIIFKMYYEKTEIITSSHEKDYSRQVKPVTDYANSCLDKVSMLAMSKLGEQGTIYPNVYLASNDRKISYFYFKKKGYFPQKITLENQFSEYVKENIKTCLNDFSDTKFVVEDVGEGILINSKIEDEKIVVEMTYPLNVYYESKIIPIEKFSAEINTGFSGMYDLSEMIFLETEKNPDWINLGSLQDTKYKVRLIKVDFNTLVYEISDDNGLEGKPFKYTFAVKYEL